MPAKSLIGVFVVGAVFGGAVGFVIAPNASRVWGSVAAREHADSSAQAAAVVAAPVARTQTARQGADTAVPSIQEMARLRARVAELEEKMESDRKFRATIDGEEVPPPPNLDPVFTQKNFTEAVAKIFKESPRDDVRLLTVDCTEYPCIIWIESKAGVEAANKEIKAVTKYLGDTAAEGSFTSIGHFDGDGKDVGPRRLAWVFQPEESPERKGLIEKRVKFRIDQMEQSFKR